MQPSCPYRTLARLTLAGVAVYVAVDVLLAFLRPGYSLVYNAESDYGRGPWFWVMDLNFLLRCALSLALAASLITIVKPGGALRTGLALLVTWAITSGLLAFFADDIEGQPVHGSGVVHLALAFVAFTGVTAGTIVLSCALRSPARPWRAVRADFPRPGTGLDRAGRLAHRRGAVVSGPADRSSARPNLAPGQVPSGPGLGRQKCGGCPGPARRSAR
jgi:hypothetical membrane protein